MPRIDLPHVSFLRQILSYDPEAGQLNWLPRPSSHFRSEKSCRAWNSNFALDLAGSKNSSGYICVMIGSNRYRAHRLAWAIHHGVSPLGVIDHINGCPWDNRIVNLRDVTLSENQRNSRLPVTNTSGACGVSIHKGRGKWQARIRYGGKTRYLGLFDTKDEAISARLSAQIQHGYTERHGQIDLSTYRVEAR